GLLSTRGIRTGLSLSMIFASLAILDMPTQHLLPQMGNLSFIDKLLFVFLMVSSTTALILNFPNKKIFERDIPFLNLVLYGLLALTISLVLLFFLTESPTALLLVGGATLFSTFFTQHTLLKKHPKQKIQLSQFSFGVQFLWLGLILGYTPLLILAGILCGIALSDSKLPEKLLNKIPINQ
ncbi:MAG: hypothetical protein JXR30_03605, partial [Alphaproteobacteria bacterium]|nr:hypothetical protein [Alphaproteobacteria bacterium]